MKGRIQNIQLIKLKGLEITDVVLNEFNVEVEFKKEHILIIEEYWEYVDSKNKLIDRALGSKLRKSFKLPEIIGSSIVQIDHVLETFYFVLNNRCCLKVSVPNFEYSDLNHYKAFGDNNAMVASGSYRELLDQ